MTKLRYALYAVLLLAACAGASYRDTYGEAFVITPLVAEVLQPAVYNRTYDEGGNLTSEELVTPAVKQLYPKTIAKYDPPVGKLPAWQIAIHNQTYIEGQIPVAYEGEECLAHVNFKAGDGEAIEAMPGYIGVYLS